MAVGHRAQAAGLEHDVAQAGRDGARGPGEIPLEPRVARAVVSLGGHVLEVHDRRRPLYGLPDLGLPRLGLAEKRVAPLADHGHVHEPRRHPGDARARQDGVPVRDALAVREHAEAVGPGAQRVRLRLGQVDEAVAGPHHVGGGAAAVLLPRQARAREDEEDLLLRSLDVRGRRPLTGIDFDQLHAHAPCAGGPAEVAPAPADVPGLPPSRLDLVPVDQMLHRRNVIAQRRGRTRHQLRARPAGRVSRATSVPDPGTPAKDGSATVMAPPPARYRCSIVGVPRGHGGA